MAKIFLGSGRLRFNSGRVVISPIPPEPEQEILYSALITVGTNGVLAGWSAIHGFGSHSVQSGTFPSTNSLERVYSDSNNGYEMLIHMFPSGTGLVGVESIRFETSGGPVTLLLADADFDSSTSPQDYEIRWNGTPLWTPADVGEQFLIEFLGPTP